MSAIESPAAMVRERLDRYCREVHGISVDTYYRWEREFEAGGGQLSALAPPEKKTGGVGSRLTHAQLDLALHAYTVHYGGQPVREKSLSYAYTRLVADAPGRSSKGACAEWRDADPVQAISLGEFWALVSVYRGEDRRKKGGGTVFSQQSTPEARDEARSYYDNIFSTATYPLQYALVDTHDLDVLTVDKDTRQTIPVRLRFTAVFDAWSRSCSGWDLSFRAPSVETVQLALGNSIFPRDVQREFGIDGAYLPYGVPHRIVMDNAWAYHSHSFEAICGQIAHYGTNVIQPIWKPPYDARRGALIERFFGSLEEEILHHLWGTTMSNPQMRARYDSVGKAVLLAEDVEWLIASWLTRVYHVRPRVELGGKSPNERWLEGIGRIPPSMPNAPEAAYLFGVLHPKPRLVDEHGLRIGGLRYSDECLAPYRSKPGRAQRPRIWIRMFPADVSVAAVYDAKFGTFVGLVPARNIPRDEHDQPLRCSQAKWEKILDLARIKRIRVLNRTTVGELWAEVDALQEQRASESVKARREREQERITARNAPRRKGQKRPVAASVTPAVLAAEQTAEVMANDALQAPTPVPTTSSGIIDIEALIAEEQAQLEASQTALGKIAS